MPDRDIEVPVTLVKGEWGPVRLTGAGRLCLTSDAVFVEAAGGDTLLAPYDELRGGGWRTGALTIHGAQGSAVLEAAQGLDQAWVALVQRACPLPELARAHRLLGSRRGGRVDSQARFLTPLLQARRRIEEEGDLETRVVLFDARTLRERIDAALQVIAKESYPSSHPDRRALEAELEEAMAQLFGSLDAMASAANYFRKAPEAVRFTAWRSWVSTVTRVFTLADTSWASASRLLPPPPPRPVRQ